MYDIYMKNIEGLNTVVEPTHEEMLEETRNELRNILVLLGSEMQKYGHNLISQGSYNQIQYEPIEVTREKGEKIKEEISRLTQKMNTLKNRLKILESKEEVFKEAA